MAASRRDEISNALIQAIDHSDYSVLKKLLGDGADINAQDLRGWTPLIEAIYRYDCQAVEFLIDRGADTGVRDFDGRTAFQNALLVPYYEAAELLIIKSADINVLSDGRTLLHETTIWGWYRGVELLLEVGADIDATNPEGETALHAAVEQNHHEIVELLVARGANVNARDHSGMTVLLRAARTVRCATIEHLLARGADFEACDEEGGTALCMAVHNRDVNVVKLLLERGADVNFRSREGDTVLHKAVRHRSSRVIELLIDRNANIDARDENNRTPLDILVLGYRSWIAGDLKLVAKLLVRNGADIAHLPREARRFCRQCLNLQMETSHFDRRRRVVNRPLSATKPRNHKEILRDASDASAALGSPSCYFTKTKSSQMLETIYEQLNELPSFLEHYYVEVETELAQFVEEELEGPSKLSSYLTFSGHNRRAYAATCFDYVEKYWSNAGSEMLRLIESSLQNLENGCSSKKFTISRSQMEISFYTIRIGHKTYIDLWMRDIVKEDVVQCVHLLSWFSAQFRLQHQNNFSYSSVTSGVGYLPATPDSSLEGRHIYPLHTIDLCSLEEVPAEDKLCWNDMIGSAVIAKGFPVPDRQSEIGLELPFDVMISLAGILYPVNDRGGTVLKGYSTALVPTAKASGVSIQWHFIRTESPDQSFEPIPLDSIRSPDMNFYNHLNFDEAYHYRAFLGGWDKIEVLLGTRDSVYYEFSPTDTVTELQSWGFDREHKFTLGLSKIMGVKGSFQLRKRQALYVQDHGPNFSFEDLLRRSARHPLLLYDTAATHAYVVPELSFVLHLAILELKYQYMASEDDLPYAKPNSHGGDAALSAILNADKNKDDLERIIRRLFTAFAERRDIVIQRESETTVPVRGSDLLGWDVSDLCCPKYFSTRKQAPLDKSITGGWQRIFQNRPDILILFGKNFSLTLGQPFRASKSQMMCSPVSFPFKKYLMSAPVRCLETLRYCGPTRAGKTAFHLDEKQYLTASQYLCECGIISCDNVLLHISGKGIPHTLDHSDGAVFIGKSAHHASFSALPIKDEPTNGYGFRNNTAQLNDPDIQSNNRLHRSDQGQTESDSQQYPTVLSFDSASSHYYQVSSHEPETSQEEILGVVETNSSSMARSRTLVHKPAFLDLRSQLQQMPFDCVLCQLSKRHKH